ncbi:hypothetical protein GCM10022254_74850 [Actinomadura meridiana]|uniref:Uncharacterized protein n=1 Tax=Actinomadura meridiana TaxID=559626 RepID=A0ABP8CQW6_9ACTN
MSVGDGLGEPIAVGGDGSAVAGPQGDLQGEVGEGLAAGGAGDGDGFGEAGQGAGQVSGEAGNVGGAQPGGDDLLLVGAGEGVKSVVQVSRNLR